MQRPKWLNGWGKGKNPLNACLLIDAPDIKVVEASLNKKILFFSIGTLEKSENTASGATSVPTNEARNGADFEWRIFYDLAALPNSMSLEKAKVLMAGIVSATSRNTSVFDLDTAYIASGDRPPKGNAPFLLDYEMAKKIEAARTNKTT